MKRHLRGFLSWVIIICIIILIILLIIPLTYHSNSINQTGDKCVTDSDCPQYSCPGVSPSCVNGFCVPSGAEGEVKCIDLQHPVCGNDICEGDERKGSCPGDCA